MARFELFTDNKKEWRWRFIATNGRTIAVSSEGYRDVTDCANGVRLLQTEGAAAPVNQLQTPTTT